MIFLCVIAFLYGSNSIPIPIQSIDKEMVLSETFPGTIAAKDPPDLLSSIESNPKEFVAQMQQLDPTALKNVITLLEDLLSTSEAREAQLIAELDDASTALGAAAQVVVEKEDSKNSADQAVIDTQEAADQAVANAQQVAATASTALDNARSHHADKQTVKDAAQTAHDDELPGLNNEQQVLRDVIAMLNGLPDAGQDKSFKWDAHASGSLLQDDGHLWRQNNACYWCGVKAAEGITSGKTSWKMIIQEGSYHQIGVALADWDLHNSQSSDLSDKFAFLYSQGNGWDRHRGAAEPINPSPSAWWNDQWGSHKMGREFTVTVDMDAKTFEVETEQKWLGKMKFPDSWTTVYPAAAGQSSDNIYRIL